MMPLTITKGIDSSKKDTYNINIDFFSEGWYPVVSGNLGKLALMLGFQLFILAPSI